MENQTKLPRKSQYGMDFRRSPILNHLPLACRFRSIRDGYLGAPVEGPRWSVRFRDRTPSAIDSGRQSPTGCPHDGACRFPCPQSHRGGQETGMERCATALPSSISEGGTGAELLENGPREPTRAPPSAPGMRRPKNYRDPRSRSSCSTCSSSARNFGSALARSSVVRTACMTVVWSRPPK